MTKISDIGEFGFIDAIKEHTLFHPENVAVGIGDDGAVYTTTPGWQQVAVIDTMVQNSHFIIGSLEPQRHRRHGGRADPYRPVDSPGTADGRR